VCKTFEMTHVCTFISFFSFNKIIRMTTRTRIWNAHRSRLYLEGLRGSTVGLPITLYQRTRNNVLIHHRTKRFSSPPKYPDGVWGPSSILFDIGSSVIGVQRRRIKAGLLMRGCIPSLPHVFMTCTDATLPSFTSNFPPVSQNLNIYGMQQIGSK
jgi:hypothetical protein